MKIVCACHGTGGPHAAIIVDKPNQKAIVIGKGGEKLKAISSQARRDMERLFGGKVYLEVWVRVRSGWALPPFCSSRRTFARNVIRPRPVL